MAERTEAQADISDAEQASQMGSQDQSGPVLHHVPLPGHVWGSDL